LLRYQWSVLDGTDSVLCDRFELKNINWCVLWYWQINIRLFTFGYYWTVHNSHAEAMQTTIPPLAMHFDTFLQGRSPLANLINFLCRWCYNEQTLPMQLNQWQLWRVVHIMHLVVQLVWHIIDITEHMIVIVWFWLLIFFFLFFFFHSDVRWALFCCH